MSIILTRDQHAQRYQELLRKDEESESQSNLQDHFRFQKFHEDQELSNPVTRISHNYKRFVYKEMFYQHNINVTLSVAEWRSGSVLGP